SISLQKASLIHRKKGDFGFEVLPFFNKELWRQIQDEARLEKLEVPQNSIFASDINEKYIEAARENALRARVEKFIEFKVGDFFELPAPAPAGLLICNMPYGERIKGVGSEEPITFFKMIGDKLKKDYAGWQAAFLVAEESPWKFIGLKPSRRIALLNGSIPVKLVVFNMYKGSKKDQFSNP
ncbi:MAG: hypothetical protein NT027_13320, partial [Proteobacteria bacterium]|nr:hypothetical protein [Pseudomonadota bacterium]